VRAIGISVPDEGVSDANTHIEAGRVDVIQVVYNVFQQEPFYTLFPLARKHNIGVIARSPFSSGVLVQSWTPGMEFEASDWRGRWPLDIKPNWLESQISMADAVRPVLARTGLASNVAALRFVLDNPAVTAVIPGSSNPDHVKVNMSASDVGRLDAAIHDELRALWVSGQVHGTYNGSI
jgi:aryl-alcohol dehydrogenase-like predicted oxidoreductase